MMTVGSPRPAGWPGRRVEWVLRAVLAAVLLVSLGFMVSRGDGAPARSVVLHDGVAWLVSSTAGQAALVDGAAAQVITQVPVGVGRLSSAQSGTDAYVADARAGTVLRIDGATFAASKGVAFGRRDQPLSVYPTSRAVFVVDGGTGLVTTADPRTLGIRAQQSLAARVGTGGAMADSDGRLWVIDSATGDLVLLDGQRKRVVPKAVDPAGATLLSADGTVMVADLATRTVRPVDAVADHPGAGPGAPAGAGHGGCLDVTPGDTTVTLAGSPAEPRVYAVSGRRGLLLLTDLRTGACDTVVDLGSPGHTFGTPREAAGRVFIPDFSTGQVIVVDLTGRRIVARSDVLPPDTPFELLAQGSFVFFNDPASARAGTVRLDGRVSRIEKYNAHEPGSGLAGGPGPVPGPTAEPPTTPPPTTPPPTPPVVPPTAPPVVVLPPVPRPADRAQVNIEVSAARARVGDPITLRAVAPPGSQVDVASWTFGDGVVATGDRTSHAWTAPGDYLVGVRVTLSDGRSAFPTVRIPVDRETPPTTPPGDPGPGPVTDPSKQPPPVVKGPVAALTVSPVTGPAPLQIRADAAGSTAGSADITGYAFDFGDGGTASGASNASHTYGATGTYTVSVTVTDRNGRSSQAVHSVSVTAAPVDPTAALVARPASGDAPLTFTLDASGSRAGSGTIVKYSFLMAGIGAVEGTSPTVTRTYNEPGTYGVSVEVTDSAGRTADTNTEVTVNQVVVEQNPIARLNLSAVNGTAPLAVTADASGSGAGSAPISSYTIDFGDGTTVGPQAATTATHTYQNGGTFTVALTVTDSQGNTDRVTRTVTVTAGTAGIATKDIPGCPSAHCRTIQVDSTGTAPLVITSMTSSGTNLDDPEQNCVTTIAPGDSCAFRVTFTPGDGSAQYLTIVHNAPGGSTRIDF